MSQLLNTGSMKYRRTQYDSWQPLVIAANAVPVGIAEPYISTKTYYQNNYCIYDGTLYRCKGTTTGTFDPTKWTATTVTDEFDLFDVRFVSRGDVGQPSGVASLDNAGKVPSMQLPSYVDDVIEGYYYNNKFYEESSHTTVITGETGKIYVDLTSNLSYRWSGSAYIAISNPITIDTTLSVQGAAAEAKVVGTALGNKVDKVTGKALSTNDFTNAYKSQLDSYAVATTSETTTYLGLEEVASA